MKESYFFTTMLHFCTSVLSQQSRPGCLTSSYFCTSSPWCFLLTACSKRLKINACIIVITSVIISCSGSMVLMWQNAVFFFLRINGAWHSYCTAPVCFLICIFFIYLFFMYLFEMVNFTITKPSQYIQQVKAQVNLSDWCIRLIAINYALKMVCVKIFDFVHVL